LARNGTRLAIFVLGFVLGVATTILTIAVWFVFSFGA
jgi:hypothetical protein